MHSLAAPSISLLLHTVVSSSLNNRIVGWKYGSCKYYNMRMLVTKEPIQLMQSVRIVNIIIKRPQTARVRLHRTEARRREGQEERRFHPESCQSSKGARRCYWASHPDRVDLAVQRPLLWQGQSPTDVEDLWDQQMARLMDLTSRQSGQLHLDLPAKEE